MGEQADKQNRASRQATSSGQAIRMRSCQVVVFQECLVRTRSLTRVKQLLDLAPAKSGYRLVAPCGEYLQCTREWGSPAVVARRNSSFHVIADFTSSAVLLCCDFLCAVCNCRSDQQCDSARGPSDEPHFTLDPAAPSALDCWDDCRLGSRVYEAYESEVIRYASAR